MTIAVFTRGQWTNVNFDFGRSGYWHASNSLTDANQGTPTLNRLYYTPFFTVKPEVVTEIAGRVMTAGTSGAIRRYGIYRANSNFLPGDLLAEETVSTETTGMKTFAIGPVTVNGLYFVGAVNQVANSGWTNGVWTRNIIEYENGAAPSNLQQDPYGSQSYTDSVTGVLPDNPSVTINISATRQLHRLSVRYQ